MFLSGWNLSTYLENFDNESTVLRTLGTSLKTCEKNIYPLPYWFDVVQGTIWKLLYHAMVIIEDGT